MSSLDSANAWLAARGNEMERLLADLVDISSHTVDRPGVDAAAQCYLLALQTLCPDDFDSRLEPAADGRFGAHVVGQTVAKGRALVLIGHHDTVFPASVFAGFRVDGPLLRGPGVLDMKGGLVVIAFALGALAQAGLLEQIPVRLVSVGDEEVGSPDGKAHVVRACQDARAALVFESGRAGDLIITRRKGTGAFTVNASGKAAHAGNLHHEGANAIWALARFIDRAQSLTDYAQGLTVNVGKIAGGIGKNTVPDRAEALLDFRFVDEADGRSLANELGRQAEAAAQSLPGTRVTLEGGIGRAPLLRTEASAALAAEYGDCARLAGLGSEEAPLLGGGSDANTAAACGVPAIDGLGPRGRGYHTVDEQIERSTLLPKAAALVHFLARCRITS